MCYTQGISAFFAVLMFSVAAYEYKCWKCWHYSIGLAYYGLMEALQAVQHSYLAVPEDDYSMCASKANQGLTYAAFLHCCFQPYFTACMLHGLYRRHNLRERIESDLTLRLCLLGGCWTIGLIIYAFFTDTWAPPATKECANYNWMRSGYDPALSELLGEDFYTPNGHNQACVYQSPSEQEHLAWVLPNQYSSYAMPNPFLHAFLFFGPHLCMGTTRPMLAGLSITMYLTGPVFQKWLTPDVNERPAIWCYGSVGLVIVVIVYRWYGIPLERPEDVQNQTMVARGKWGEKAIVYQHALEGQEVRLQGQKQDAYDKLVPELQMTATSSEDDSEEDGY